MRDPVSPTILPVDTLISHTCCQYYGPQNMLEMLNVKKQSSEIKHLAVLPKLRGALQGIYTAPNLATVIPAWSLEYPNHNYAH